MGAYLSPKTPEGYNDLLSKHIRGLKKYVGYVVPLSLGLASCVQNRYSELLQMDLIVPVPKHPTEVQQRGYNQAHELSSRLSIELGIPLLEALVKTRPEKMRELLTRADRKETVKGLYVTKDNQLNNMKILLIDDVSTSGATVSECSKVLLDKSAYLVNVLVAGRDVAAVV